LQSLWMSRPWTFLFPMSSIVAVDPTQPSIHWSPGLYLGVKQPLHEVKWLPLSSAVVEINWSYTGAVCVLLMDRDNLPITLISLSPDPVMEWPSYTRKPYGHCFKAWLSPPSRRGLWPWGWRL
jgi:hypothetical protein